MQVNSYRLLCFSILFFTNQTLANQAFAAETKAPSRWIGMVDQGNERFGWPGSGLAFEFEGTSLTVMLTDAGRTSLIAETDGNVSRIDLKAGTHAYTVSSDLSNGRHHTKLMRRVEGSFGDTTFVSAQTEGQFIVPSKAPKRHIMIIGDSISAGYGVEGKDTSCSFSGDTENQYLTYGAVAGRMLDAEVTTLAVSGAGAGHGGAGGKKHAMMDMILRPTPSSPATSGENIKDSGPFDAIVINLGTNDFSDGARPPNFEQDYIALVDRIRSLQPHAHIYAAMGPMLRDNDFAAAEEAVQKAVDAIKSAGDDNIDYLRLKNNKSSNWGCNWHPSAASHQELAHILAQAIRDDLNWSAQ